jgi:peroxiredoxin
VVIIGVGINDSADSLTQFAKSIGVTYPIAHDRTSEVARHYRIRSLPTTYRIDQEGRVRGVAVGALDEEHLINAIEELMNEK